MIKAILDLLPLVEAKTETIAIAKGKYEKKNNRWRSKKQYK